MIKKERGRKEIKTESKREIERENQTDYKMLQEGRESEKHYVIKDPCKTEGFLILITLIVAS